MTVNISFKAMGAGQPLICLHGYALDHTIWHDVANLLKETCMLILPDLRGHGGSASPSGEYTMREMAEDVAALQDSLGLDSAFFAGHSMGGYVMLALAENFPEKAAGLALVASHAFADSLQERETRLEGIRLIKGKGTQPALETMPQKLTDDLRIQSVCRSLIQRMDKNGLAGSLSAMAGRADSVEFLQSLAIPLGIIAGVKDHSIPLEKSRRMADLVKPALYMEIENSGHMPMMENPVEVAQALASLFNLKGHE